MYILNLRILNQIWDYYQFNEIRDKIINKLEKTMFAVLATSDRIIIHQHLKYV